MGSDKLISLEQDFELQGNINPLIESLSIQESHRLLYKLARNLLIGKNFLIRCREVGELSVIESQYRLLKQYLSSPSRILTRGRQTQYQEIFTEILNDSRCVLPSEIESKIKLMLNSDA